MGRHSLGLWRRPILLLLVGLGSCTEGQHDTQALVLADCIEGTQVHVWSSISFRDEDPCELANRARGAVLASPDSSVVIDSIFLISMSEANPSGSVISSHWQAQFFLSNEPFDLQVLIDRSTEEVEVERIHKPI